MVLDGCGPSAYRLPVVVGLNFLSVYFEIFSTTGDLDMSRWNIGEHKLRRRDQEKFALTWFAQR